jgi:hypothetical protein
MKDMPNDVATLQARLATARQEFSKLLRRVTVAESRAAERGGLIDRIERCLRDVPPADEENDGLVLLAWDATIMAGMSATAQLKADRLLDLLRQMLAAVDRLPKPIGEQREEIGWRSDMVTLLVNVRSEIEQETAPCPLH